MTAALWIARILALAGFLDAAYLTASHYAGQAVVSLLPPGNLKVRFFVAELIRETVFELLRQEVPYSTAVQIDEFRESATPVYIRATIYVERESQKGIVVGTGGAGIRELGAVSRRKIESFLDTPVYLDLWVKAKPGWRRKKSGLEQLGYEREAKR